MNVSLSTHLFVFHPLDDAVLSLFPKYGFSLTEIWAMPPHFPYADGPAADRIAEGLARHGVRIASLHGPIYPDVRSYKKDRWFSLSSTDEERRLESVDANRTAAEWLARRGGGTVVLHTGFPEGDWYPHRWASFLSSLGELVASAPAGVRFAVENTPVGSGSTDIVRDIVERFPPDRVGICIDLGHAHVLETVEGAVRTAGDRLIHVHASDNHGIKDDHLVPGRGSIPWDRAISALAEAGFGGPFTIELRDYTRGDSPPYNDFDQILAETRSALDRILGGAA
ncbi:MAG: sugar phosphate isomerase/epimerase family protein [Thermodesulfobacteriota bacterium]